MTSITVNLISKVDKNVVKLMVITQSLIVKTVILQGRLLCYFEKSMLIVRKFTILTLTHGLRYN